MYLILLALTIIQLTNQENVTTRYRYTLKPIENNVGVYYQRETQLKVSNDKWTLLVYKDVSRLKKLFDNNNRILHSITSMINIKAFSIYNFYSELETHVNLLIQTSDDLEDKFNEIDYDVSTRPRKRRGLINAAGSVWKFITGNLDSSDGEYYNNCINKIEKDEREVENLLKKQITVTTSVIKSFNETLRKFQIDEITFNNNIKKIEKSIHDLYDQTTAIETKLELIEIFDQLTESYSFIENQLNDILNAITFAKLNIIHTSIITPKDLVSALQTISQNLKRNNLPLAPREAKVATYLDIIELSAFQTVSKLIFVLDIPLTESQLYTVYRLYPIPTRDNRTKLHYILPTIQKYIAKSEDSDQFIPLSNIDNCKEVMINIKLCKNLYSYPIDSNAMCEAQLLKTQKFQELPKNCQMILVYAQDYKIQLLSNNIWLLAITDQTPVTIKCENIDPITEIININSIMTLQPGCLAFIGSTRVQATMQKVSEWHYNYTNTIQVPNTCCQKYPENSHKYLNLKPIKISQLNLDDLEIAKHKLDQYSEELDDLINEPAIKKYYSWFTYVSITLIVIVIIVYIYYKCKKRKRAIRYGIETSPGDPPDLPPIELSNLRGAFSKILPRRRPGIRVGEPIEEGESLEFIENTTANKSCA